MKKTFISIITLAASILAVSSCKKEDVTPVQNSQTIVFNATTDAAKTVFDAKQGGTYPILWDQADTTLYAVVNSSNRKAKLTPAEGGKKATIELTVKETDESPYNVVLGNTAVGFSKDNGLNIPVPSTQNPTATSVDRNAIAVVASADGISDCSTPIDITFKHFAAYGRMSLKNLPAGAVLTSVSLTADEDWVGNWYLKVNEGTFTPKSGSTGKALVVNTASAENIWFACAPVDLSGKNIKITAITSNGQYTKTITLGDSHKFTSGHIAEFSVNMAGITPDKEEKYTLTAIEDVNETDEVVITMKLSDGTYYAMTNDKGTDAPTAASVAVSDNVIVNPAENLLWNIYSSAGSYVVRPDGDEDNNLYTTNANNGVKVGETEGEWTPDGDYLKYTKQFGENFRYLGVYVDNGVAKDWRTYTNTTGNIKDQKLCLFVKAGTPDTREAQKLSFPKTAYEAELGSSFTAPTLSGAKTTVTYSSSNTNAATVDASTGAVTLKAAGKTTITANAVATDAYKAGKASYELTVKAASVSGTIKTLDELFAAATAAGKTAADATVEFGNWVISGVKGKNAYATDGTKGFIIFKDGHGFEVGDKLSGTAACKVQLYNGSAEITDLTSSTNGLTITKGGIVTPIKIAIADLSGINTGAVITFDRLTYNGEFFTDGTNTITPYGSLITLPTLIKDKDYKVTGMYVQFNDKKEIAPRSADDFVVLSSYLTATASKTSVSADGETVTITVNTNADSWSAKSDNSAFVVGEKSGNTVPVTVSANTSTTSERTAKITVSAEGVEDVVITLTQMKKGDTKDYSTEYTSNVELSTEGGTSASTAKVIIGGKEYDAIKAGTSSKDGVCVVTIPAGTKVLHFHAAGWKGASVTLDVSGTSYTLVADDGVSNNSPFTLVNDPSEKDYFTFTPDGATEITFSSGKRFVLFGVNAD